MKITAIPSDRTVLVDGVARQVDLTSILAGNIHALQWDDALGGGEIEYRNPRANSPTTLIALRDNVLAAWVAAKPPDVPPPPPPDPKAVDLEMAGQYVVDSAIKAEADKPTAPDYVKRAATELEKT